MILNDDQRLVLQFILAAERGGHGPTDDQVNEWMHAPEPDPGTPDRRVPITDTRRQAERDKLGLSVSQMARAMGYKPSATFMDNVQKFAAATYADAFRSITAAHVATSSATSELRPGRPAESLVDSLVRLEWLQRVSSPIGGPETLSTTSLGRALLLGDRPDPEEGFDEVFLSGEDPVAYEKLVGRVADMGGNVFVVDPYLRIDQLRDLLDHTKTTRVLVGCDLPDREIVSIRIHMRAARDDAEVRQAPEKWLHDRYLITPTHVYMLGSSFNTTSNAGRKSSTSLIPLSDPMAVWVRDEHEKHWRGSDPIAGVEATGGDDGSASTDAPTAD